MRDIDLELMDASRRDIRKKVFVNWINFLLSGTGKNIVTDILYDLRTGLVLIDILEILFTKEGKQITLKRELGSLRVHYLANINTVINVLRENRVRLEKLNSVGVVDGQAPSTLALVWAIIVHWQLNIHLSSFCKGDFCWDHILLAWCRQSGALFVEDFNTETWSDGRAFTAIWQFYRPDLPSLPDDAAECGLRRLEFVFGMLQRHAGVPQLLDPSDLDDHANSSDLAQIWRRCIIIYVSCMFEALYDPSEQHIFDDIPSSFQSDFMTESMIGSPNSPIDSKSMDYETFCSVHEDVLEWLLEAEDKLPVFENSNCDSLEDVKMNFETNRSYMAELDLNKSAIIQILLEGKSLIELPARDIRSIHSSIDEKDVRIRLKLLSDRWDGLRCKAMEQQSQVHEHLMCLQANGLKRLKEWMMESEDRISRMGDIGSTVETVEAQLEEQFLLQKDLEKQQVLVNSISSFIFIESGEGSSSNYSIHESDLEDQLNALGERWDVVCNWAEARWYALQDVCKRWKVFNSEIGQLSDWIGLTETVLRKMEANLSQERSELTQQTVKLETIRLDAVDRKKHLDLVEGTANALIELFEPENRARENIARSMEQVNDRWEILCAIMDAQELRLSTLKNQKNDTELSDDLIRTDACNAITSVPVNGEKKLMLESLTSWFDVSVMALNSLSMQDTVEKVSELLMDLNIEFIERKQKDYDQCIDAMNIIKDNAAKKELESRSKVYTGLIKNANMFLQYLQDKKQLYNELFLMVRREKDTERQKRLMDRIKCLGQTLVAHPAAVKYDSNNSIKADIYALDEEIFNEICHERRKENRNECVGQIEQDIKVALHLILSSAMDNNDDDIIRISEQPKEFLRRLESLKNLSQETHSWRRAHDLAIEYNQQVDRRKFFIQIKSEIPDKSQPIMSSIELSQQTSKISALKDRISSNEEDSDVTKSVLESYARLKKAGSEYGECRTLLAQESDWLDRLEKTLRKSSAKSAADAEEISEKIYDIENCLQNRPNSRMIRLSELTNSLVDKNVIIESVMHDTERLENRWKELSRDAQQKTKLLEESIVEAQEIECKILNIQNWLTERDQMLSSQLNDGLSINDDTESDDVQKERLLREFEDQENALSEMDDQVELFRSAGRYEAATRLEDQLQLLHELFQELAMKFELFQAVPAIADYEPRLARICRQIEDIHTQASEITEVLTATDQATLKQHLHAANCCYNALAAIKPEVENVIKMGLSLMTSEQAAHLKQNVDTLKNDFNTYANEVTRSRKKLEVGVGFTMELENVISNATLWFSGHESSPLIDKQASQAKLLEVYSKRSDALCRINRIQAELCVLCCSESSVNTLREKICGIKNKWKKSLDDFALQTGLKKKSSEENSLIQKAEIRCSLVDISSGMECLDVMMKKQSRYVVMFQTQVEEEWTSQIERFRQKKLFHDDVAKRDMTLIDLRWMPFIKRFQMFCQAGSSQGDSNQQQPQSSQSSLTIVSPALSGVTINDDTIITLANEDKSEKNCPKKNLDLKLVSTQSKSSCVDDSSDSIGPLLSSRDSSPESASTDIDHRPPIVNSKKAPKTKPKPAWYLANRQRQQALRTGGTILSPSSSSPSPERVKVTIDTLPSPQTAITKSMEHSEIVHNSFQSKSQIVCNEEEEIIIARDNILIDQLLSKTDAGLIEVAKNTNHDNDVKDFERQFRIMICRLDGAGGRLELLDSEHDLKLRHDLINMELRGLEVDVAPLICLGESLISMDENTDVKVWTAELRSLWSCLKKRMLNKAEHFRDLENSQQEFLEASQTLRLWLDQRITGSKQHPVPEKEIHRQSLAVDKINQLAAALDKANALSSHTIMLALLNAQWQDFLSKNNELLASTGPNKVSLARIYKMIQRINCVEKQLRSNILTERPFENLEIQSQTLGNARLTLDQMWPNIRKLQCVGEATDDLRMAVDKLWKSWRTVLQNLSKLESRLRRCKECLAEFDGLCNKAVSWLDTLTESDGVPSFSRCSDSQIDTINNVVMSSIEKLKDEIVGGSSAEFGSLIKARIDRIKNRLRALLPSRVNMMRDISIWMSNATETMAKSINVSDGEEIERTLSALGCLEVQNNNTRIELTNLINCDDAENPDLSIMLGKLDSLSNAISKCMEQLHLKQERLEKLLQKLVENENLMMLNGEKQDQPNQYASICGMYSEIEREVDALGLTLHPDLFLRFKNFKQFYSSLTVIKDQKSNSKKLPSPVVQLTALIEEIKIWLISIENAANSDGALPVHDLDAVRQAEAKQKNLMLELENKRPQLDEVECLAQIDKAGLSSKVIALRKNWDLAKRSILSRKTELTAMAGDSEQYLRKSVDIKTWLERQEAHFNVFDEPVGRTLDELELQLKQVMFVQKECTKFHHRIKLFIQVSMRMRNVYAKDDTSEIVSFVERLETRYAKLEESVKERSKAVQVALNSLANFHQNLDKFITGIVGIERSIESMERNSGSLSDASFRIKLNEIKTELARYDSDFVHVVALSTEILARSPVTPDASCVVIRDRISDISSRWKTLQNRVFNLGVIKDCKVEENLPPTTTTYFHNRLSDHMDWIRRKRGELASLSLTGDFACLLKQSTEHDTLRLAITEKRFEIDECLKALGGSNNVRDKSIDILEEEWIHLMEESNIWKNHLDETLNNVRKLQHSMENLQSRLEQTEHDDNKRLNRISNQLVDLENILASLKERACHLPPSFSHSISSQLKQLETRLQALRTAFESNPNPDQVEPKVTHHSQLPPGWECEFTEDDCIPYYVNHADESTHWDHPFYVKLIESLTEYNKVKFSVYRLSLKLRKIQQKLKLDCLEIDAVLNVLTSLESNCLSDTIFIPQMTKVLERLYASVSVKEDTSDVSLCITLCLNWLLNVYDPLRSGRVRFLSFKIGIILLCHSKLSNKYVALFNAVIRTTGCDVIFPSEMAVLLLDCILLPKCLGEAGAFGGPNIEPSVRSCFMDESSNRTTLKESVDLNNFLSWLGLEPQCLVWLPVLHRTAQAESARHIAKCKVCRMEPIIGFRYHCLKCFNFDLCHGCFLVGAKNCGHKSIHPLQEYCTSTGSLVNFKNFTKSIRNSFRSKAYFARKRSKLCYLPVDNLNQDGDPSINRHSVSSIPSNTFSKDIQECRPHSSPLRDNYDDKDVDDKLLHSSHVVVVGSIAPVEHSDTVDWQDDDEHNLITRYCQILWQREDDFDQDLRLDVERNIVELELQNRHLTAEYDQLVIETEEARKLKQTTKRMEARMNVLQDHNEQLESQLQILRSHSSINYEDENSVAGGTLQRRSVVAEHAIQSMPPPSNSGCTSHKPPIIPKSQSQDDHIKNPTLAELATSDGSSFSSNESLNLSQHETQTVLSECGDDVQFVDE